jgi:hypothetical protein
MKDQLNHQPWRSTSTWLARVAAIARNPTRTGAPVVAIGHAKTGLDLTFAIAVAA